MGQQYWGKDFVNRGWGKNDCRNRGNGKFLLVREPRFDSGNHPLNLERERIFGRQRVSLVE